MAVHDVGSYRDGLKPGHVFSVDPQLRVPEENLYLRYEDTVVVTETGVENFTALPADGAGRHGSAGAGEGPRAEGAGRTVRRGPARQVPIASEDEDQAGGELGLPHDVDVQADDAAARARGAGVDVHERREHPAVEPQTQVPRERELDAATAAEREPDLVVAVGPVVGEPQEPGDERPRTARSEVLAAAGQPMIDAPPGFEPADRTARRGGRRPPADA